MTQAIRVVDGDADEQWQLQWIDPAHSDEFVLTLVAPDDRSWSARGWNMFEAFTSLREQLDPLGFKLCCQGARTRTAISGMAADMGRGMMVYRIKRGRVVARRDLVGIFDPAPVDEIGTVGEQAAYRQQWLGGSPSLWQPRNLASYLRHQSPLGAPLTRLSDWWWFFRMRHRRPRE
jgi:hypothetical protein